MVLDIVGVKKAIDQGVSVVCATCSRFWEGREKGLPFPSCTTLLPCGGPIAGLDFPRYEGPISNLEDRCFVCGTLADFGVKGQAWRQAIGVCKVHLGLFDRLKAEKGVPVVFEVHSPKGIVTSVNGRYTKNTLVEEMIQTEQAFAEAEGHRD